MAQWNELKNSKTLSIKYLLAGVDQEKKWKTARIPGSISGSDQAKMNILNQLPKKPIRFNRLNGTFSSSNQLFSLACLVQTEYMFQIRCGTLPIGVTTGHFS